MTTYEIVLSVALAGVSLALQYSVPTRGFAWRHAAARVPLAAQLLMGLALAAGLFWSDDTQRSALQLAGWLLGTVIGGVLSILRPRTPREADTDAIAQRTLPR